MAARIEVCVTPPTPTVPCASTRKGQAGPCAQTLPDRARRSPRQHKIVRTGVDFIAFPFRRSMPSAAAEPLVEPEAQGSIRWARPWTGDFLIERYGYLSINLRGHIVKRQSNP